jgi:hypothetical protein
MRLRAFCGGTIPRSKVADADEFIYSSRLFAFSRLKLIAIKDWHKQRLSVNRFTKSRGDEQMCHINPVGQP